MATTIQISDELWQALNNMKTPKEKTFEDVLLRLLNQSKSKTKNREARGETSPVLPTI
jgi:predicted CopG family antitoxin